MIKIPEIVRDILLNDEEALSAISNGYMNLSAYAKRIHKTIERRTKKSIQHSSIVVALSRLQHELKKNHPLIQDIKIDNVTTKAPLTEIVFDKSPSLINRLHSLYSKVKTGPDDFLMTALTTSGFMLICSDRLTTKILNHLEEKPKFVKAGLAAICLSLDPKKYYPMPNITFSLIRRIARKRIPLAETVTTYSEIIFVFEQKNLADVLSLFLPEPSINERHINTLRLAEPNTIRGLVAQ